MTDYGTVRGCCWGAGRLLESLGIDTQNGACDRADLPGSPI